MTVELHGLNLGWLGGDDDEADQCAHGAVHLCVDGQILVGPDDGELTVSAAGLYLLRTLETDHVVGDALTDPDHNQLFPCCGHSVFAGDDRCVIVGCATGVDVWVRTKGDVVTLQRGDISATVSRAEWREAVLGFVGQVDSFYAASSSRDAIEDAAEAAGWQMFWAEWKQRVSTAAATL